MAEYRRCPHCGKFVSVEKNSNAFRGAGGAAAGAAVGSFIPGIGTLIGAGVGYLGSRLFSEDKKDYTCPQCGMSWNKNEESAVGTITTTSSNTSTIDDETLQQRFQEKWDYFLNNEDEIIKDEKSMNAFTRTLSERVEYGWHNANFLYIKAVACMEYLKISDPSNTSLINRGLNAANKALTYLDDDEFRVLKCIFQLCLVDPKANKALDQVQVIDSSCPVIEKLENTYLKPEYLRECYDSKHEDVLFDIWSNKDDLNDFNGQVEALKAMSKIKTNFSVIVSNKIMSDLYYEEGDHEDPEKAFKFVKKAYEGVRDFEFQSDNGVHQQWLASIDRLAYCYAKGYGTKVNTARALELLNKSYSMGSALGAFNLGVFYEDGLEVEIDKEQALEYYRVAAERGYDAESSIKNLEAELGLESETVSTVLKTQDKPTFSNEIFISYSRKDTDIVDKVVSKIEEAGFKVWIDRDGIESGDAFKSVIVDAIEECQVVLFFSSEGANSSPWTEKEIGIAVESKKTIIPIKLDNSRYSKNVRFDLVNLDFIDLTDLSKKEVFIDKLIKSLESKIVKTVSPIEGGDSLTDKEQEYLDSYRRSVDSNGNISSLKRKILEKIRTNYGITESRAKEIEVMASSNALTADEKEYLETYREALSEGSITKDIRMDLDDLLNSYGISKQRAAEIEGMV